MQTVVYGEIFYDHSLEISNQIKSIYFATHIISIHIRKSSGPEYETRGSFLIYRV